MLRVVPELQGWDKEKTITPHFNINDLFAHVQVGNETAKRRTDFREKVVIGAQRTPKYQENECCTELSHHGSQTSPPLKLKDESG